MAKRPDQGKKRGLFQKISGRGPWPMKVLRWLLLLGLTGGLVGVVLVVVLYFVIEIPDPNADFQTQTTNVYYSDGKSKIGSFANQDRQNLRFDEIPQVMKDAVVAAEDRSFWENKGIDVRGIARAARDNASSGEITGGGSTITQQYVKILYLNQDRSYQRKIKEAILSVKIHNQRTKEEILEGYLNTIYFGNGAYGVEVASQTYFRKPAAKLTVGEAAYLATVINSPTYFDAYAEGARDRILPRYNYVIDGMVKMAAVSAKDGSKLRGKLPKFKKKRTSQRFSGTKGHLLDLVQRKMRGLQFSDNEIVGGGYKIVTTFDKKKQKAAVASVKEIRPDGIPEVNSALVSVEPGSGAVRSMYGGPDYLKNQLNWATLDTQPGSTFKVFAVIAALEDGYSLSTRLNGNSPIQIGDDSIVNQGDSGGRSYGTVSLAQATENSVNTAFVDLTDQMKNGGKKILKSAVEAGIPQKTVDKIDPVIGVSLGYAPVSPIDMANSYATLAADGNRAEWHVIDNVEDSRGNRLYQHRVAATQAIDEDVAADTLAALQAVTRSGTGTQGRTVCPTIGKTGTATAVDKDISRVSSSWFVGATPKLATAVMYNRGTGNEELRGYLNPFFGGTYPAITFRTFMNEAIDPADCGSFPKPANLKAKKGVVIPPKPAPAPKPKPKPKPTKEPEPEPEPDPEPEPTTPPPPTMPTELPPMPTTPPPDTTQPPTNGGGQNKQKLPWD